MPPLTALLSDWVITACWPLVGAAGMKYFSGLTFTEAGLVIGLVLLAPWMARRDRWRRIFDPRYRASLAAMGFFSGAATALYIAALAYTTPANAAITAQIEVIYSAILSAYFLGERPGLSQSAASFLVIAGTGLIMAHDLHSPRWRGDLMILATPWMYQISHVFSKRLPKDFDAVTVSGGRVFYGILALAPFWAWSLRSGSSFGWRPAALEALLLQGVFLSSVNFVLWYQAILNMDLAKATAVLLSYPALTMLFSWLLGRESIAPIQVAGLTVTLTGALWISSLVLAAQKNRPSREQVVPEAAVDV
jgi:drug/metabolite transporter (DMT)-like permease